MYEPTVEAKPVTIRVRLHSNGPALWPERFSADAISRIKRTVGSFFFASLYQQRPSPEAGGKFRREWFRYYKREGDLYRLVTGNEADRFVRVESCIRFVSVDVAGTEKKKQDSSDPDYTVFSTFDLSPEGDLIWVDLWRDRCEEPEVVKAGVRVMREHDCQYGLIERNGLGAGVVNTLKRRGSTIHGVHVKTDKVTRAQTAMIRMEAGMVFLPRKPFTIEIESECLTFPNAAHDDIVDTLSLAAMHAERQCGVVAGVGDSAWQQRLAAQGVADAAAPEPVDLPPDADEAAVEAIETDPELKAWLLGK